MIEKTIQYKGYNITTKITWDYLSTKNKLSHKGISFSPKRLMDFMNTHEPTISHIYDLACDIHTQNPSDLQITIEEIMALIEICRFYKIKC